MIKVLLPFLLFALAVPAKADFTFQELKSTRLPYGESFEITGDTALPINSQSKIGDLMVVESVRAVYTVSGRTTSTTSTPVTGNTWSVTIGELPENSRVS